MSYEKQGWRASPQLWVDSVPFLPTAESPLRGSFFLLNLELTEDPKGLWVFHSIYQAAFNCVCVCVSDTPLQN